mgnify:FL=1
MEVRRVFDLLPYYKEHFPEQKVALAGKVNGKWIKYSIDEYIELSDTLSGAFIELGVKPQDKIAVICGNRPEWNMLDMAITQIGAVMVPIYPTISEEDYKIILNNCEAEICILEGIAVMNKVEAIMPETPSLKKIYTFVDRGKYPFFANLVELGKEHPHAEELAQRKAAVDEMSCATIIYTSGTTGVPKGVMLSHHNLMNQFKNFCDTPSPWSKKAFSFLPVCHAYERALIYMYHYLGMSIYYAESIATIADNMLEIHPTMMCAVPRVLEKFYEKIYSSGKNMKGFSKTVFYWAMKLTEKYSIENRSKFYDFKLRIADRLVYSKIRAKMGAENFDIIVSGAASITKKVSGFFSAIKMPVFEGYGLTETSPVIAVSTRGKYGREVGTVGRPLPGVEVKVDDSGEILCRGHNVMMGYYKQPELTAEVIDKDGWFHTGDLGHINEHGLLVITGRKKNLFKTSLGKYINPDVIENKFINSGFVEQIVVLGESQKFAAALIRPDFAFLKSWCKKHMIKYTTDTEMIHNEQVVKRYAKEVKLLNEHLGEVEKIKRYELIADEWTIANGIMTPTLKVKRKVVMERYGEVIDKMFK